MKNNIVFDIETTGLKPWRGSRVTCIGAVDQDDNWFIEASAKEGELLSKFNKWLLKRKGSLLVSKGGERFDIPFLCARQSRLTAGEDNLILDFEHFDLESVVPWYKAVSLQDLANIFNVPGKSGSGKQAIRLFEQGRYDELKKYCMRDVALTKWIFEFREKIKQDGLGPSDPGFSAVVV